MQASMAWFQGDSASTLANTRLFLAREAESDALRFRGWVEAVPAQALAMTGRGDEAEAMLAAV